MEKKKFKFGPGGWIFVAMILGILVGLACMGETAAAFTTKYVKPVGTIYVNLLKFMVVPVVLFSIIDGVISLGDIKKVGSIGWKTMVYYLLTTAVAVCIGLAVAITFKNSGWFPQLETTDLAYEAKSSNIMDVVVGIFPSNWLEPLVSANMLQTIVIALFFGAAILMTGDKGGKVGELFNAVYAVVMQIMMIIIDITPIGVFCLMVNVVAVNGAKIIGALGLAILAAYIGYLIHVVVVYGLSVKVFAKLSPIAFFKGMAPAMITAFTTTSSAATLPLTIECSKKLGADDEVASFVLPLGATINMDGTAIYMGITSVFIAFCYGVDLTMAQMATIVITATLASIGTAGVSGAGMIMLAMVLQSVGLPVEGIALIAGVDKLFDMGRTCLNVTGDGTCALAVSNWQKKLAKK
ncbi:MAG: dicarboxylate/amino acid:cation symporter [Clostridiales bacterium]|nr:dicarboxylate/amino acid:cation symporter [Candidatus Apopatocola equi]